MRRSTGYFMGVFVCWFPAACAVPCLDDGLGQDACPTQDTDDGTGGATRGNGSVSLTSGNSSGADTTQGSASMGMSGSQTGVTAGTAGATGSSTDSASSSATAAESSTATESDSDSGANLWCEDIDGDGFGDPDSCQQSDTPVDGSVPNGDDCDDDDPNTFPGAAPNDSADACMRDADGDDWGDTNPPPGVDPGTDCLDDDATIFPGAARNEVDPALCARDADMDGWGDIDPPPGAEPGSDCDDDNPDAFPGAAPNEDPPELCTTDADGDGWGDATPDGGAGSGSDCYDGNIDLNPDTMGLTAFLPYQGDAIASRTVGLIDTTNANLSTLVTLLDPMGGTPNHNIVTATMDDTGAILANDFNTITLYEVDYGATCMMGTGEVTPAGPAYGAGADIVCGLEYGADGMLYAVDHDDQLLTFDPVTGQITSAIPLDFGGMPIDIFSCGMAHDCHQSQLLIANGPDLAIYSVEIGTGVVGLVRDLTPFFAQPWIPTGIAYDPVSRNAYLSTGPTLYAVDLDSLDPPVLVGFYGENVSNLQFLPLCQ
ncbi:MAG: hypothetical protein K0V04_21375 [Deltaproteobacteria bacterium]|nr:hypothetical protein [Deltaproteobacteria bacterium]